MARLKGKGFLLILTAALLFFAAPALVVAQAPARNTMSWDDPGGSGLTITFSTPATYASCPEVETCDTIWTDGVPTDWSLQGWVQIQFVIDGGRVIYDTFFVDQTGDLELELCFPQVSEWDILSSGVAELHVDLSIRVYDQNGSLAQWVGGDQDRAPGVLGPGQDWDVFCLTPPPPPDGQGCTPGFWKQPKHLDSWIGFDPASDYETTFGVDASFTATLLKALGQGDGGEYALGRHAVAALLNAASPDVNYDFSVAQIILLVQSAYASGNFEAAKNLLEAANELGCPLD